MKIPWAKPTLTKEDKQAVVQVLESNWLTMGPKVQQFEHTVSQYLNIKHAIAVNNGTAALDIAVKCLGIKKGDEIIIPALTYIATGNAVLYNHATPVFVDIDDTLNINPSLIEERITEHTKAIINIDLGGNASNYNALQRISKHYDIPLIVDGAQSFGSIYHNTKCCTHGIINTTSFHAAKILTTIEGGMVLTNDDDLSKKSQILRNQGDIGKFDHQLLGNNYRMTDLVAAIGNSQMKRLEKILQVRQEKVNYYKQHLQNIEYPKELSDVRNCNFFFLILVDNRDKLKNELAKRGIETRITYPLPINEQPLFKQFSRETFQKAKEVSQKILSLPLFHALKEEEQKYIVEQINKITR